MNDEESMDQAHEVYESLWSTYESLWSTLHEVVNTALVTLDQEQREYVRTKLHDEFRFWGKE